MPLRPFPYQLGIGTDIVKINRIRGILQSQKIRGKPGNFERFLKRFLTPRERHEFHARYKTNKSLSGDQIDIICRYLSGRWAAKEAAIKAVPWRRLSFHDIVVLRAPDGRGVLAVIRDAAASGKQSGDADSNSSKPGRNTTGKHDESPNQVVSQPTIMPDWDEEVKSKRPDANLMQEMQEEQEKHDLSNHEPSDDSRSASERFEELTGQIIRISISHDGEYATAVCLAAEEPLDGDVGGEAAGREPF